MGFDRRGYYYRSVRDGDRVLRVYLGNGPVAQLAALMVQERRSGRRALSLAWQAREAALAGPEDRLRELDELAERMTRATLLAAGYHRHDRGLWRRRRMHGSWASGPPAPWPGPAPLRANAPNLRHFRTKPAGDTPRPRRPSASCH